MGAILIAGGERRFYEEAFAFRSFLKTSVGMREETIEFIGGYSLNLEDFRVRLMEAFERQKRKGPLLLAFNGHGSRSKDGWSLNLDNVFPYEFLVRDMLLGYPNPVMFLNDCCFAAAPIKWFKEYGIIPENLSLIAAVNAQETCYSGLLGDVLSEWKKGRVYNCKRYVVIKTDLKSEDPLSGSEREINQERWGAQFDHHFSPASPLPARPGFFLEKLPQIVVEPEGFFGDIRIVSIARV